MADNVVLNTNTTTGVTLATDEAGSPSVHYQRVKLTDGTADSTTVIASGNGTNSNALRVTVASDSTGVIAVTDNNSSLTTDFSGVVSTGNATTTALGSNASWTGTFEEVKNYACISFTLYADVSSANNGLELQWSGDGTNIDKVEYINVTGGTGKALTFNIRSRYFRVKYTNGASAQSTFRVSTVYRYTGTGINNYPINNTITSTSLSTLTRSVIVGESTAGGGSYVNVKVSPSGGLPVDATQSGTWNVGLNAGTNAIGKLSANDGVDIGDVTINNASIAVTGTFWQATQPVSIASAVPVTDNSGSLTVDAPVGTPVFVRLSDGTSSISTLPVSLASVPSHAVTNAGTFAVQESGAALTALQLIDDAVYTAGTGTPSKGLAAMGTDGTNPRIISTTTAGAVNIADGGNSITVDGTVAATQSGTWNIGSITTLPALASGTNTIGGTYVVANATGGTTLFSNAGTSTKTQIGTGAKKLYWIHVMNLKASVLYLQVFNNTSAGVTLGTTSPDLIFPIPTQGTTNGAGFNLDFSAGVAFGTGLTFAVTTTATGSTTASAGECYLNAGYA